MTPGEGIRIEELTELSHHSLIQYRLPATGELIPLLQITPSKTDAERLLVIPRTRRGAWRSAYFGQRFVWEGRASEFDWGAIALVELGEFVFGGGEADPAVLRLRRASLRVRLR